MLVFRPRLNDRIQLSIALAREALHKVHDALSAPMPDTFLGRKIQEPFPYEDDDSRMRPWLPKELRPPT